ncbi:FAD-binding oxidoreductase [Naumannella sp. ID2617S]|nr:FAD-binding oxidoreductase [Naumannella sp. ID2617S]
MEQIVVVGAGITGLATAWYCQQRGIRVTVVDRTGVAAGASWGNAGYLTPELTDPLNGPLVLLDAARTVARNPRGPLQVRPGTDPRRWLFLLWMLVASTPRGFRHTLSVLQDLRSQALGAHDELAAVSGVALRRDPFLVGYLSVAARDRALPLFAAAGPSVDPVALDQREMQERLPILGDPIRAGIELHGQAYVNPPQLMAGLADAVRAGGAEILEGVRVDAVHDTGSGVRLSGSDRELTADAVVLANGAWLNELATGFGVRSFVQAGRGYSFSVWPDPMPTAPIYLPEPHVACNPLGDRFRVTSVMEFNGVDAPLDQARIRSIVRACRPLFPGVDWAARQDEWVGSRPCTADGLALVGATRSPRVFVHGGHGMWGLTLGPLTARLLAEQLVTGQVPRQLRALDPLR